MKYGDKYHPDNPDLIEILYKMNDDIGTEEVIKQTEEEETMNEQVMNTLIRCLRLIQLLCENHNLDLQNQLRVQTNVDGLIIGKTQDLISELVYMFGGY